MTAGALHDPDSALLEEDADDVLLGLLARDTEPQTHYGRCWRNEVAPAFDRAEFVRHMQAVARRKREREERAAAFAAAAKAAEEAEAALREREKYINARFELDTLLADEAVKKQPKPQPVYVQPSLPLPAPEPHWKPKENVEPWFDLSCKPTLGDMRCIAQYALGYFVAARQPGLGATDVGERITRVVCPRTADMVATALQRLKNEIPVTARISACLLDVPEGLMAVVLGSPHVALRVASVEDGKKVSIEMTWDE